MSVLNKSFDDKYELIM